MRMWVGGVSCLIQNGSQSYCYATSAFFPCWTSLYICRKPYSVCVNSLSINLASVQLLSHVWLFATPWTAARQASLSITNSWSWLKPMSIESVMPSSHLILCCPLLLLPSIFPSIRVFSNESALCIRWPKYWSFSFNISPSNEHPGLISFRMDWLDLLAVQGTLKSLLQHHTSKASIFGGSAFFIVQLSHPYMTTGKTIALTKLGLESVILLKNKMFPLSSIFIWFLSPSLPSFLPTSPFSAPSPSLSLIYEVSFPPLSSSNGVKDL